MRSLLTVLLALWLVAGCSATPEQVPPPGGTPDFLEYCTEVMPEVRAFTQSVREMERTQDEAYFDDMLVATRAIDDISTEARKGLRGVNPPEGEWLRELGLAARGFHTLTVVTPDEDYIVDRIVQILDATERATQRCSEEPA